MTSKFSQNEPADADGRAEVADVFGGSEVGARLVSALADGPGGHRKLAEFVLRNPIRASVQSIEDLAVVTGVSAPTVSRFARRLGYAGFAELKTALAATVQTLVDPVAKLSAQLQRADREPGSGDMLTVIQDQVARLDASSVGVKVAEIAALVTKARHVHVMGFGLSAHVAGLLVLGLQPFHPAVSGVVEFGGTEVAAGRLMAVGPDDLLIAISFPRYAKDAIRLLRYARDRRATTVAITDSPASPLAAGADAAVFAPAEHPTLSSSYAAAVAVVETLIATVMLSDPANAERAALLGDAISGYLQPV